MVVTPAATGLWHPIFQYRHPGAHKAPNNRLNQSRPKLQAPQSSGPVQGGHQVCRSCHFNTFRSILAAATLNHSMGQVYSE